MQFSIYDHKNMFLEGYGGDEESREIYVGPPKTESDYAYMKPGPAGKKIPSEGGDIAIPYFAEFRITGTELDDRNDTKPMTLSVLGAAAVKGEDGVPKFKADGSPEDEGLVYTEAGRLTIPEPDAEEPESYRVAVSSNKYKWFKAQVEGGRASAFLLRG